MNFPQIGNFFGNLEKFVAKKFQIFCPLINFTQNEGKLLQLNFVSSTRLFRVTVM